MFQINLSFGDIIRELIHKVRAFMQRVLDEQAAKFDWIVEPKEK